jgi:uroporphyrinogen-III decarboxylase
MTDEQWDRLLRVLRGERLESPAVAFLVDGPWVAANGGVTLMQYFTDTHSWLHANLEAVNGFPQIWWLPGFWAEFGMISNPPAFGTKCVWPEEGFPSCEPILKECGQIVGLPVPNVTSDGLLPLIIQRMRQTRQAIERTGHRIRFACSHGPITIASYLLGHNEFFLGCRTERKAIRQLIGKTTQFVVDWLQYQQQEFDSIDGVLVLEDLMGFVGQQDFESLVLPAMKEIFSALDVAVRFLHNDAFGLITAQYLQEMGVNLFNFSFEHSFAEIRQRTGEPVTLMGNIAPRDVLGLGTTESIRSAAELLRTEVGDASHVIFSAGGFTPSTFSPPKIRAFLQGVGMQS